MADLEQPPKDSLATRISKKFDQMIKDRALQRGREQEAQRQAQQQQQQQSQQAQAQAQENRSTVQQVQQNTQATDKAAKDIEQY